MINEKESLEVEKLQIFEEEEEDYEDKDVNVYGFLEAAQDGDLEVVKQYIKDGGDIDAIDENRSSVEYGWTALMHASYYNHHKVVKYLIEMGADMDLRNREYHTALMIALEEDHLKVIKYFIDAIGDINAKISGDTVLILASINGRTEVVKYLIEMDANINTKDEDGMTALMHALENGRTEVVKILENPNEYLLRKKLDIENASDVIKDSCIF